MRVDYTTARIRPAALTCSVARRDDVDAHPTHPALVVEIADSGLRMARGRMAAAYPRARIAGADLTITPLAAPAARVRVADLLP